MKTYDLTKEELPEGLVIAILNDKHIYDYELVGEAIEYYEQHYRDNRQVPVMNNVYKKIKNPKSKTPELGISVIAWNDSVGKLHVIIDGEELANIPDSIRNKLWEDDEAGYSLINIDNNRKQTFLI